MVYFYLYKNHVSASNALIWLYFREFEMTRISRTVQRIPQVLRDTLR